MPASSHGAKGSSLAWLARIPELWRGLFGFSAVVIGTLGAGYAVADWGTIPTRLAGVEAREKIRDSSLVSLSSDIAALREATDRQLCLQVTERDRSDWRLCFLPASPYAKPTPAQRAQDASGAGSSP